MCPSTQSQRWLVGEVLELAASREPQFVIVVDVADAIDATAVASSVDHFSWFSIGGDGGQQGCAWHAARVHHRCRFLTVPEAPCEALGSLLRRAWDPRRVAGQSPANVMWRLLLEQAHVECVGSKYDEAVITQTMQVLAPRMASRHTQRRVVPASVQVHLREASTRDAAVAAWPLADKASLADFGVDALSLWLSGSAKQLGHQSRSSCPRKWHQL